jgi:hypothetical protein
MVQIHMIAHIREKNRAAGRFDDDGAGIIISALSRVVLITNRIAHELNSFAPFQYREYSKQILTFGCIWDTSRFFTKRGFQVLALNVI